VKCGACETCPIGKVVKTDKSGCEVAATSGPKGVKCTLS